MARGARRSLYTGLTATGGPPSRSLAERRRGRPVRSHVAGRTPMQTAPPGNPQAGKSDKRRRVWGWIFAGCGTILGIGAIISILFVVLFARGRSEFTPPLEEFLALIDAKDYDQAYSLVGDKWKTDQSFEEFRDFFALVSDALGPHRSARMTHVHYQKNLGSRSQARTVFIGRFEKAKATLRVVFQKYDDAWRIDALRLDSDAITSALTCPHCGTVNSFDARHCSSCGVKIERPPNEVEERQRDAA